MAPALYPSAVYRCSDPQQAAQLLAGELPGFVYRRTAHPNANMLAAKCQALHNADQALICGSGMAALSVALLGSVQQGDHLVISDRLYGQSLGLCTQELTRLGVEVAVVNTHDLEQVRAAMTDRTRLVFAETITNPMLRVSPIAELAEVAHAHGARLLIDNTFATPLLCAPIPLGADLVVESLTKMVNGHSDVILGMVAGTSSACERLPGVLTAWGFDSSPFDCWLALRGIGTLAVRMEKACQNALALAQFLEEKQLTVAYPGLTQHPDHAQAAQLLRGGFGTLVTFTIPGGLAAAGKFIQAVAEEIPFSPSLGDLSTTLSHPASTSHRLLPPAQRQAIGIDDGTLRISVGLESFEWLQAAFERGLAASKQ